MNFRGALLAAVVAVSLSGCATTGGMNVALLGDSLAFGAGDETGQGIAGRLEPELRRRGIASVATTNLAVTGATTSDLRTALQQPAARAAVARADAVVISIGANDLRATLTGEERLRSPIAIADQVLRNIRAIVDDVRYLSPDARILILGGYAPFNHDLVARLVEPLIKMWDAVLLAQFIDDPLVTVVRLSDIVDRPGRLSTVDSFHPAGEAYQEAARRIAELLIEP